MKCKKAKKRKVSVRKKKGVKLTGMTMGR